MCQDRDTDLVLRILLGPKFLLGQGMSPGLNIEMLGSLLKLGIV